jgi:hypothetical protein
VKVRLTHIDGKLPNLALMKLSHWHKSRGDEVYLHRAVQRDIFEPEYDVVYGSAIFTRSLPLVAALRREFPKAIIGGTGAEAYREGSYPTVEALIGDEYEHYDYDIYPDFQDSLGFTQRGCRLACGFCIVPKKEGRPRAVSTIPQIYRGEPWPRNLFLLDNDFFGQPKADWEARVAEIKEGDFKVCFDQGINVRLVDRDPSIAPVLASLPYYDDQFKHRRLYTAWDNLKDEAIFMRGVKALTDAGIPPAHLMVYMLIGFDPSETMDRIMYRFTKMLELGVKPYPMVYNREAGSSSELKRFQRWVARRYYEFIPFAEFSPEAMRGARSAEIHKHAKSLFEQDAAS